VFEVVEWIEVELPVSLESKLIIAFVGELEKDAVL
jgi:hypothetical protein